MKTDRELKIEGFTLLAAGLGEVQAERFIALVLREPFDYTRWQCTLWPERSATDLSAAAMEYRRRTRSGRRGKPTRRN